MKFFLVGEGRHDIGDLAAEPPYRDKKPGFMQPIVEQLVEQQVEFDGQKVSLLGREPVPGLRDALEKKAWMAAKLAEHAESDHLVFIIDLDRGNGTGPRRAAADVKRREEAIARGFRRGVEGSLKCTPGIACRTIEAWALGDVAAVAAVRDSGEPVALPAGKGPEDLWGERHDPSSNHPKMVLNRLLNRITTQEDLSRIAEKADAYVLRVNCPLSFEPFAAGLQAVTAA